MTRTTVVLIAVPRFELISDIPTLPSIAVRLAKTAESTAYIIGKTGSSGGSRVPHLHLEIRKSNTEETGLAYTIDPLELLPDIDLNSLTEEFTLEPYASLWRKLTSDKPWEFSKEDIPYADDKNYIR